MVGEPAAVKRGEIWWADLPEPDGSGPGFRRPVLVVQASAFNRTRINTAVVVAITGNIELADAPGNVFLPPRLSGLPRDSVVNVTQVAAIDRRRLSERVSKLDARVQGAVDEGLRRVLSL